jgi:hypothetical protein
MVNPASPRIDHYFDQKRLASELTHILNRRAGNGNVDLKHKFMTALWTVRTVGFAWPSAFVGARKVTGVREWRFFRAHVELLSLVVRRARVQLRFRVVNVALELVAYRCAGQADH